MHVSKMHNFKNLVSWLNGRHANVWAMLTETETISHNIKIGQLPGHKVSLMFRYRPPI